MSYDPRPFGGGDRLGAFVPGAAVTLAGAADGPLAGLTFAAKDLFDVRGHVTGCGNPDWQATHPPAARTAWAVDRLLAAGATLAGKTITDEISLGLLGINRFFGTPVNPRAPDRVPGGSSSGSAAAVAGGLVDTALGTDSGGSVRVPSSFTGLYGLRPTHGRLPVDGMMTQAPSFDTVGFFARDAATFARVGNVLLTGTAALPGPIALPEQLLVADDCFAIADPGIAQCLRAGLPSVASVFARTSTVQLAGDELPQWAAQQRLLQGQEFGRTFRDWVDATNPRFSSEVAGALASAASIDEGRLPALRAFRTEATARLEGLLEARKVLCLPTAAILPPVRHARLDQIREANARIIGLTCIAGLSGLPQVNLPLAELDGIPVGLSLIGWRGADEVLLALADTLSPITPRSLLETPC